MYFVSARLSNTEGEGGCGIQHEYIYCIIVLYLYCICLLLYVALERGNKKEVPIIEKNLILIAQ